MKNLKTLSLLAITTVFLACRVFSPTPTATPTAPAPPLASSPTALTPVVNTPAPNTQTSAGPSPIPTRTAEAASTPIVLTSTPSEPERPEEEIMIFEPGPGSQVTSPVRVAGLAGPTFEQNLVIRILSSEGDELALQPVTIVADLGERGPFEAEMPFQGEGNIFIQVYSTSARDGGITHLSSVVVSAVDSGPAQITNQTPHPERISIFTPVTGDTIQGGEVQVEGFALASFEQNLVIQVLDENGNVIETQPVTVQAPDLGQPGPFSARITYSVAASQPGRIVVRDMSPANGEDVHLSSVEVNLLP